MIKQNIQEILLANPPIQFSILQNLLDMFAKSHSLESAYVRGSLSTNSYDRTSDVDLVLSIFEEDYIDFVNSLDTLIVENFGSLFSGWFDRIVPKFGGIGFVYLIPIDDAIFQIDLYIIPSNKLEKLMTTPSVKKVYWTDRKSAASPFQIEQVESFVTNYGKENILNYREMFIEAIIISFLISKRIKRMQLFLNHSETVLLNQTFRDILRLYFDPDHINYGWYHIESNLLKVPNGEIWIEKLKKIVIEGRSVHTLESIKETLGYIQSFIDKVSPNSIAEIKDSYQYFLSKLGR